MGWIEARSDVVPEGENEVLGVVALLDDELNGGAYLRQNGRKRAGDTSGVVVGVGRSKGELVGRWMKELRNVDVGVDDVIV